MAEKKLKSSEKAAFRLIEEMLELMESRGLVELEIEQEGLRIRLKKAGPAMPTVIESVAAINPQAVQPQGQSVTSTDTGNRVLVKSPMVGTFYRAPAPEAPPFVEVGQDVETGQVVCIIEAMKLMNEIKSEVAGRVIEVLAENGGPVEFGQALLAIEPPAA